MWAVIGLWYATCQSGGGFKGRPVNRVPTQVYGAAVNPTYEIAYTAPWDINENQRKTEQNETKQEQNDTRHKQAKQNKTERNLCKLVKEVLEKIDDPVFPFAGASLDPSWGVKVLPRLLVWDQFSSCLCVEWACKGDVCARLYGFVVTCTEGVIRFADPV